MFCLLTTLGVFVALFLPRCYAEFDLPRCLGQDVTGIACNNYAYDATWVVTNAITKSAALDNADLDVQYMQVNGAWPPPTITV